MLHLLRTLRGKLIQENRIGKYLLYAVGEIVLVVIGILIALYLDDLHTESLDREKEQEYLHRFQSDLEQNLLELDRVVGFTDSLNIQIDSILAMANGEIPPFSDATFNRLNLWAISYLDFRVTEATVEDILGSGKLDLIQNDTIREAIAAWESGLVKIRGLETTHKKSFNDLWDYHKAKTPMYRLQRRQTVFSSPLRDRLMNDTVYLNTLAFHAFPVQLLNREFKSKREAFRKLAQTVQKEIKSEE